MEGQLGDQDELLFDGYGSYSCFVTINKQYLLTKQRQHDSFRKEGIVTIFKGKDAF